MANPVRDVNVRLTEMDSALDSQVPDIPARPAPTPKQARLGIIPAAIGNGTIRDIMDPTRTRPNLDDAEFQAFERAIAENRAMRRQLAEDRGE